jgi:hypothetical protein
MPLLTPHPLLDRQSTFNAKTDLRPWRRVTGMETITTEHF